MAEGIVSVPPEVAYVAACALGLAFSEHQDELAVAALARAADHRWQTLEAAIETLPRFPSGDPSVLRAAAELLGSAAAACRADVSSTG